MKKVGREVLVLTTSENNPRNGEGSFARLSDGRIMYGYTEYVGESREDHATARLAVCYSSDEGETWSKPEVLLEKDPDCMNYMAVSLLKLANGELGMIYCRKDTLKNAKGKLEEGFATCMPVYRYSKDDGKTWSEEIACSKVPGYFCVVNHKLIQLKSGRLLLPMSRQADMKTQKFTAGSIAFIYSDDNGRSWDYLCEHIYPVYDDAVGLQEPGVIELDDGRLWMYCRTGYGHQWQSYSSDGGKTWSTPMPNWKFTSPNSPMLIDRVKDIMVAVYNPQPFSPINLKAKNSGWPRRTPLLCAISKDGGKSFENTNQVFAPNFVNDCVLIEDDPEETYCYPAVIETADGFLVAYYHSYGSTDNLNVTKFTKICWSEIEDIIKEKE